MYGLWWSWLALGTPQPPEPPRKGTLTASNLALGDLLGRLAELEERVAKLEERVKLGERRDS